jgi:hypothetical protein
LHCDNFLRLAWEVFFSEEHATIDAEAVGEYANNHEEREGGADETHAVDGLHDAHVDVNAQYLHMKLLIIMEITEE